MEGKNTSLSKPLFEVIRNGNEEEVNRLINASADINQQKNSLTPLHCALNNHHYNIIVNLIKHGADVNALIIDIGWADYKSETYLEKAIKSLHYFESKHTELLSLLLAHGANPNVQSKKENYYIEDEESSIFYPIHSLIRCSNEINALKVLLEAKANVNAIATKSRSYLSSKDTTETPLHMAVMAKNLEMVKLLIEYQADVNVQRRNIDNRTIEREGGDAWQNPRLPGYVSNVINVTLLRTSLHLAIQEKSHDIVRHLILCGANPFIYYKEHTGRDKPLIKSTWELCGDDLELIQLLDIRFTPKDYKILPNNLKITLKILLLCDVKLNWKLPKDVLFKIFSYVIQSGVKLTSTKEIPDTRDCWLLFELVLIWVGVGLEYIW